MTDAPSLSSLERRLGEAMNDARRTRDRMRTNVLSMTLAELRNRRIEAGRTLTEEEVVEVVAKARKRRQEAAEQMRVGGREELAAGEEAEGEFLAGFLPRPLTDDEVRAMIRAILDEGVTEMGPLMGRLMPRVKGRFDGKEAQRLVREALSTP